jgi:hypothetical protein
VLAVFTFDFFIVVSSASSSAYCIPLHVLHFQLLPLPFLSLHPHFHFLHNSRELSQKNAHESLIFKQTPLICPPLFRFRPCTSPLHLLHLLPLISLSFPPLPRTDARSTSKRGSVALNDSLSRPPVFCPVSTLVDRSSGQMEGEDSRLTVRTDVWRLVRSS